MGVLCVCVQLAVCSAFARMCVACGLWDAPRIPNTLHVAPIALPIFVSGVMSPYLHASASVRSRSERERERAGLLRTYSCTRVHTVQWSSKVEAAYPTVVIVTTAHLRDDCADTQLCVHNARVFVLVFILVFIICNICSKIWKIRCEQHQQEAGIEVNLLGSLRTRAGVSVCSSSYSA